MSASVYKKTATIGKSGVIYAFGRSDDRHGQPKEAGGYFLFKCCTNYNGRMRGGLQRTWRWVERDLPYAEVVTAMNKRCGYEAFKPASQVSH